ncbi:MAG: rRNA maturation RNase YbeY [Rhizobiales bacterium 17-65-6]|nr:MAG: rRNA maturation RNase YbeY [Rhizobiales bacterium 12-68-15]OYX87796.1 MAG: rRNA maturation RNase YbeY [Azorhizobium sp. 32-67-21]OZA00516.1 MAG: rRNA maturation RNase YbeY [Rhizobiales bacterium 17-65-6]
MDGARSPSLEIDILVEADGWAALPDAEALVRRAVSAALAEGAELEEGATFEVSVTLTDDARIRRINKDWRDKDKPTNVLSFPAAEVPDGVTPVPLGDIIVAFETVAAEALDEDKALADHFTHLIVHGTLHLVGFDHEDEEEAEEMEDTERHILAGLGISDPYALPAET